MKKVIIMIPVFNDWASLTKLLGEINKTIDHFNKIEFECLILNDASTIEPAKIFKPQNIKSLRILNIKKNQGHARCNAFGIRFVLQNEKFDYLLLMDGDGEDRPEEINNLINKVLKDPSLSVVAKRVKRSEGPFFQLLYKIHKLITFIFTGKKINFGNYSLLTKKDAEIISKQPSLWSSYSGTLKKYISFFNEINSFRGTRYFGPSKMSLFKLLIHSFSIIAVFKFTVFLRSTIIIVFLAFFLKTLGLIIFTIQILIILFCILVFLTSLREKKDELDNCYQNLKDILTIH